MSPKYFIAEKNLRESAGSGVLFSTLRSTEVAKVHRALPLYLKLPNIWKIPSQKKEQKKKKTKQKE